MSIEQLAYLLVRIYRQRERVEKLRLLAPCKKCTGQLSAGERKAFQRFETARTALQKLCLELAEV